MPLHPLQIPKGLTSLGSNVGVHVHTTEKHTLSQLIIIINRKAIPVQAWTGPGDSTKFRLPGFETIGTWRW